MLQVDKKGFHVFRRFVQRTGPGLGADRLEELHVVLGDSGTRLLGVLVRWSE